MIKQYKNSAYFLAIITEIEKETLITGSVKRPVMKVKCYDSHQNIAEVSVVFSSISQIRKSTIYEVGDIIQFSASIGECPMDNLVFYPKNIHLIKKCPIEQEPITDTFIKSRLLYYLKEVNEVFFEGYVYATDGKNTSIEIENEEILRGSCLEKSHIWVKHSYLSLEKEEKVCFIGEMTKDGLQGQIYKK